MLTKKENMLPALCALFLTALLTVLSVSDYFAAARQVRSDVLRLHILANSNSEADQEVKLKVRDRLLEAADSVFGGDISPENAAAALTPELQKLTALAQTVLRENGFDYGAQAHLVTEYFDTRAYDGFTLPAGTYTALRIVLGRGEGQNWWCVMFPPLCLPAAKEKGEAEAVFSESEWKVIHPAEGYQIRFKLVEIYERLRKKWEQRRNGTD